MDVITVEYKNQSKLAAQYAVSTVVFAVAGYLLRENFIDGVFIWFYPLMLGMMVLSCAYFFLKSKRRDTIHAEGITVESAFGTKTYPWADIRKFYIEIIYGKASFVSLKRERIPFIKLHFKGTFTAFHYRYREDIDAYIRRFYGQPDYDEWTKE